jgi:glutamine amidotransferase
MTVEVLDLGINNLRSLTKSIESLTETNVKVISNASDSHGGALLILPGVGNFGTAIRRFHERNFLDVISTYVKNGNYILGICLGMQMLSRRSEEDPNALGLGLIDAEVKLLPKITGVRVPNVGWLEVEEDTSNLKQFNKFSGKDFYFTHSYYLEPRNPDDILLSSYHGQLKFTSGVNHENVIGFQFHPEKSSKNGASLLSEVLVWANVKN